MSRRKLVPFAIFVVCSLTYVLLLGERVGQPTPNNHFVHQAQSFLAGQLGVLGNKPPGNNDWALYKGTWYVSFPPFPALVILPAVAIWGTNTLDALFWAILAGLPSALLFLLLRRLSDSGASTRSERQNLMLTALFAFGSVYFFVAVQGAVWFSAQVVASGLLVAFLLFSMDAAQPLLAGATLGALIATRPPTLLVGLFFLVEVLRRYRRTIQTEGTGHPLVTAGRWLRGADLGKAIKPLLLFSAPLLVAVALQLWMNAARFDDPFVFGHEYLQIKWKSRIDTWGLFNLHYVSKNLAVFAASLPWLTDTAPHLKISLHGLALWFTTPNLLWLLWPAKIDARMVGLYLSVGLIALLNLCYQNSGWIQFGYRFSLDYMPMLIVLLALGGRRFGPIFALVLAFAIAVNSFGAATFDRSWQFYDNDWTQNRLFQPD